jgi:hypothetical protein
MRRSWTGRPWRPPAGALRPLLIGFLVITVAFTVYRNTPWGSAWYVD